MSNKRKRPSKITADMLRSQFHYDPDTGIFIRTVDSGKNNGRAGEVAGMVGDKGYIRIGLFGEKHSAHRLAWLYMTGEWPSDTIDHEDRNPLNNRWVNLRPATMQEQGFNHGAWKSKKHTSLVGAFYRPKARGSNKWTAAIRLDRVLKHLGYFPTAEAAHAAYMVAKASMHVFSQEKPN